MFELYTLTDTVIIKPNDLVYGIESKLIEELKKRYAGKVIPAEGLCVEVLSSNVEVREKIVI